MRLSRALQPQDKKKKLIHLDGIHKKIYNESKQPHRYFNYSSVTELYLKDKNLKSRKLSIRIADFHVIFTWLFTVFNKRREIVCVC